MTVAPRRHDVHLTHPVWSRDAAIYQINTRQFTEAGTFEAASQRLPKWRRATRTAAWIRKSADGKAFSGLNRGHIS